MAQEATYVVTFFSHFDAVQFSRRARQQGLSAKLMPVPRKVSSSCGTGAQLVLQNAQALTALLDESVDKVYRCDGPAYTLCYDSDNT